MADNPIFRKPIFVALPTMALLMLWAVLGPHRHRGLYLLVFVVLFCATFGLVGWHLLLSFRRLVRGLSTIDRPEHPRLFGRPKWKVYLVGAGVFALLLFIAEELAARNMTIYREALDATRHSAAAGSVLGNPWTTGWFVNSNYEIVGENGHAEFDIAVEGRLSSGRLYGRGTRVAGLWMLEDVYLVPDGSGGRIDIAH